MLFINNNCKLTKFSGSTPSPDDDGDHMGNP